ncbi:TetR/AcrR family transcriptional regulator [Nocardia crassostreae]|uniref:TetR/AcrR family transcriptional regulator n=1 Tax=Nocardia crassostreae TaxID=53428 RepID=UPI0008359AE5|nr:TetR family transcriptional regulator C-terminal domain-containing protein [Nocardia crassostreae]
MPRQVDPSQRLAAVGDAVTTIAITSGFGAVTIRAVAEHIGASTSAVTYVVGGRDDVLRSAVRHEIEARRTQAETAISGATGATALRALIEWAVLTPDERTHRLWLAMVLGARTEPVLRAELDEFNAWWDQRVRNLLADSGIRDIEAAADILDVTVDGLVVTAFDEGTPWPADRRRLVLDAIWSPLGI